jgi:hypothetical protein
MPSPAIFHMHCYLFYALGSQFNFKERRKEREKGGKGLDTKQEKNHANGRISKKKVRPRAVREGKWPS